MNRNATGKPATRQEWMDYIDAEVLVACRERRWRRQIRRKWSARDKPVSASDIDDYEWKLTPFPTSEAGFEEDTRPQVANPNDFDEGTYFVLGVVSAERKFVLEHDTQHCGLPGDHWFTRTFTEIDLEKAIQWDELRAVPGANVRKEPAPRGDALPPSGMLARFLFNLTKRFRPNQFSIT